MNQREKRHKFRTLLEVVITLGVGIPDPAATGFPFHGAEPIPAENVPVVPLNVQFAMSAKFSV